MKDNMRKLNSEEGPGYRMADIRNTELTLVSVLIPAFNVEAFISDCLDSVLCQQDTKMEVIVVDDGSTDGTADILKRYAIRDPRLRIIRQENSGPAAARNRLLDEAHGKWIYFCDADDMIKPGALSRMLSVAERDGLDALFFSAEVIYDTPQLEQKFPEFKNRYSFSKDLTTPQSGQAFFAKCIEAKEWKALLWLMFVQRKVLVDYALRFQNGNIVDDAIFVMSVALHAGKVKRIPDKLYTRRLRENSIMTSEHALQNVVSFSQNILAIIDSASRLNLEPAAAKALGNRLEWTIRMARQYLFALSEDEAALFAKKSPVFNAMMTAFSKTRTEDELSQRDASIASLKDTVSRRDASIASLKDTVSRRDASIASLKDTVSRRDASIASLKDTVSRRDASIASLKVAVSRRDASIASLKDAVSKRDESIISLKKVVLKSRSENVLLQEKLLQCKNALSASRMALSSCRKEVDTLRHSMSYRVGAILLKIPRLLLGLFSPRTIKGKST